MSKDCDSCRYRHLDFTYEQPCNDCIQDSYPTGYEYDETVEDDGGGHGI